MKFFVIFNIFYVCSIYVLIYQISKTKEANLEKPPVKPLHEVVLHTHGNDCQDDTHGARQV